VRVPFSLVVTHDRAFLSATCAEVLELDSSAVYRHRGNYEAFLVSKAARLEVQGQQTAAARNKLKSELKWVQRACVGLRLAPVGHAIFEMQSRRGAC